MIAGARRGRRRPRGAELPHAAAQVLLNAWFVAEFAREISGFGQAHGMTFWGNRYDPSLRGFRIGFVIWAHYNNKYVELLDTAWMLLRKKSQQARLAGPQESVGGK